MPDDHAATSADAQQAPLIRRLSIERYRGIQSLVWHPSAGINVVLGGGDVGKTTILEAIGLLLSPTNAGTLSDTDYYARDPSPGFVVDAVLSLPPGSGIDDQVKASWPWQWNGTDAVVPTIEEDGPAISDPVYRLQVCGSEDLELTFHVLQPNGTPDFLSVGLRRAIGLVRLAGDDRSDRDLRLVQGSALDRLLSDRTLRSRLARVLAHANVGGELSGDAASALQALNQAFVGEGLPGGLGLALTGGPGPSIASLIGLTADRDSVDLPLTTWGAGTRRLAALAIAAQNQGQSPITIVDEIERGLEPYRQHALIEKLQRGSSQVFLTTHSPAIIAAATSSRLWFLDHEGRIGALDDAKTARHRAKDPNAFLARFSIIAEGKTEVGFTSRLLERALASPPVRHGIHVSDGNGHEATLGLLEALTAAGVSFGGFADDEELYPTRWQRVEHVLGDRLFRWQSGCLEQNLIAAVPDASLEALIADPLNSKKGMRLRTLADRLGIDDKTPAALRAAAGDRLKALIVDAAIGAVPDGTPNDESKRFESHAQTWFKTIDGGRELADKLFSLGLWPQFRARLLPFCNAVRAAVGLDALSDIES